MVNRTRIMFAAVATASLALGTSALAAQPSLSALDLIELEIGYTTLLARYYEPVTPHQLADGARTGIVAYLVSRGVRDPKVQLVPRALDSGGAGDYIDSTVIRTLLRYRGQAEASGLVQASLSGEASSLHDAYTLLFRPDQSVKFNQFLNGTEYGGIGATLVIPADGQRPRVESLTPGGPAPAAGLLAGDEIDAIDGVPAAGKSVDALTAELRGKSGTTVRLSIIRGGAALAEPIAIVRAPVRPPVVDARLLPGEVGYVRLASFGGESGSEVAAACADLLRRGARAFVLDLRGNGGGYGDEARNVASIFIKNGPIFTTRERDGSGTIERADGKATVDVPLAVLVDGDTASASEIVAGAVQDDRRGTIVGTKTFGKGVVQSVFPLPDGASLKVTTARYFTPRGRYIDGKGIVPDVVVTPSPNSIPGSPETDPQLARALAVLASPGPAAAGPPKV